MAESPSRVFEIPPSREPPKKPRWSAGTQLDESWMQTAAVAFGPIGALLVGFIVLGHMALGYVGWLLFIHLNLGLVLLVVIAVLGWQVGTHADQMNPVTLWAHLPLWAAMLALGLFIRDGSDQETGSIYWSLAGKTADAMRVSIVGEALAMQAMVGLLVLISLLVAFDRARAFAARLVEARS